VRTGRRRGSGATARRLAGAALLCLLLAAPAAGRLGGIGFLPALRGAELALVGRVVAVSAEGGAHVARVEVVQALHGSPPPEVAVASPLAPSGLRLGGACYPESGAEVFLLLAPADAGLRRQAGVPEGAFQCAPGTRSALIAIDGRTVTREAVAALVEGYAARLGEPEALAAFLRERLDLPSPELRAAVRTDLQGLLGPDDVPFLLGLFADRGRDPELRTWAVRMLGALAGDELPAELAASLPAEPEEDVRRAIVRVYGDRGAIPVLRLALRDLSPGVRVTGVRAFAVPAAVPVLEEHLARDPDPEVVLAITETLGSIATPDAVARLRRLRADTDDARIAAAARRALILAGERP